MSNYLQTYINSPSLLLYQQKVEVGDEIKEEENKNKEEVLNQKTQSHKEQLAQARDNQENLENLRSNNQEEKFREVSRLRNDNENLRTSFDKERTAMNEQKEARIGDILRLKKEEENE